MEGKIVGMPNGGEQLFCPICRAWTTVIVEAKADVSICCADTEIDSVHVRKIQWDNGSIATCSDCGYSSRLFMFKKPDAAWVYLPETQAVIKVKLTKDCYCNRGKAFKGGGVYGIMVSVPDPNHEDGSSSVMLEPYKLYHSQVAALEFATEHTGIFAALVNGLSDSANADAAEMETVLKTLKKEIERKDNEPSNATG
jgi:hypothetical protein